MFYSDTAGGEKRHGKYNDGSSIEVCQSKYPSHATVSEWTEGRNYDGYPTPPTPFHVVFQCSNEKKSEVIKRFEVSGLRNINELSITEQ